MRQLLIIITFIAGLAATACSGDRIPFVYRIDVPQGNIVTQEMLNQLEVGMDKPRVRYIMGSPMLVDAFHQDRWDYIYLLQPGRGERKRRLITLHFENDQLVRISGDVRASADIAPAGGLRKAQDLEVPLEDDKGVIEGLIDRVGLGDDDEEKAAGAGTTEPNDTEEDKGIIEGLIDRIGLGDDDEEEAAEPDTTEPSDTAGEDEEEGNN